MNASLQETLNAADGQPDDAKVDITVKDLRLLANRFTEPLHTSDETDILIEQLLGTGLYGISRSDVMVRLIDGALIGILGPDAIRDRLHHWHARNPRT